MPKKDLSTVQNDTRTRLADLAGLAVETIAELAEGAERDNVRLAAAEAILDRIGLGRGATLKIETDATMHEQATSEAAELVSRIQRNAELAAPARTPEVDTLIVLEGDTPELPVAREVDPSTIIDVPA